MGYTHYWDQAGPVDPDEWSEFTAGCARLFALVAASDIVLSDWEGEGGSPAANAKEVSFNGTGAESHETFRVTRKKTRDAGGFCKTSRKNYDTAVAAILLYLDSVHSEAFYVTSDGHLWNYREALTLARLAWPAKANMLDFPRSLREKARFNRYLDSSRVYEVCLGHDGVTYIEERQTKALRCLPENLQGEGFNAWVRTLDNTDMRKYGSFSGKEHDNCERKRLLTVWDMSASNPAAPVYYNPMTHGLLNPELTSAHTW